MSSRLKRAPIFAAILIVAVVLAVLLIVNRSQDTSPHAQYSGPLPSDSADDTTPQDKDTTPGSNTEADIQEPLFSVDGYEVVQTIYGLKQHEIGFPQAVDLYQDQVYVLDKYSTTGLVKRFNRNGMYLGQLISLGQLGEVDPIDLVVGPSGNIYILTYTQGIFKFDSSGTFLSSIVFGEENTPRCGRSIDTDENGNLYVLSMEKIYIYDEHDNLLTVFGEAGDGPGQIGVWPSEFYIGPSAIAVDQDTLYVADTVNNRIVAFDKSGNFRRDLLLGLKDDHFGYISDISVDDSGYLYVADAEHQVIEKISRTGKVIWSKDWLDYTEGASGESGGFITGPYALAGDAMDCYIIDLTESSILRFSSQGRFLGSFGDRRAEGSFIFPKSLASDRARYLYIAAGKVDIYHPLNNKVLLYDQNGRYKWAYTSGFNRGQFVNLQDVAVTADRKVLVLELAKVQVFDVYSRLTTFFGAEGRGEGQFSMQNVLGYRTGPMGTAVSPDGRIAVADTFNHRILFFNQRGSYLSSMGRYTASDFLPNDIAFDSQGNLFVLNAWRGEVEEYGPAGQVLSTFGEPGTGPGQFGISDAELIPGPLGIAVDNDDNVIVADTLNHRLQVFSNDGEFIEQYGGFGTGNGEFYNPFGVTIDRDGHIWVADTYNHRVVKLRRRGE